MGTPARFTYGVTNVPKLTTFANFIAPAPGLAIEDFDDFLAYNAAQWTVTNVGTTPTQALVDGVGGLLQLTTVASAASSTFLQKVGAAFQPVAGKQFWFQTRFSVSDALDTQLVAGVQLTDTTPLDATDGIYFIKPTAASGVVNMICRKDATTGSLTSAPVVTLTNNTFVRLGLYYDGKRTITAFVNDLEGPSIDLSAAPSAFLPDALLRVSIGVGNGGAVARNAQFDYVFVAQER